MPQKFVRLKRKGRLAERLPLIRKKADPDWTERLKAWRTNLQEHLPAMVQDVPVLSALQPAAPKVDVSTPVSKPFTVKSEDTTFDAAVIFGREDWRVGLMGSFTTRSLDTLYKQERQRNSG